eukprot:11165785-Karenia_brevis.AAC.1
MAAYGGTELFAASSDPVVNARDSWATSRAERELGLTFACDICGTRSFGTRQQLALHKFRQHGQGR